MGSLRIAIVLGVFGLGAKGLFAVENNVIFNPKTNPSQGDWQSFHQMDKAEVFAMWAQWKRKGAKLQDWHWAWRLGWVRRCGLEFHSQCRRLLIDGLWDPAMVVRSESAIAIGQLFEGSQNKRVTDALVKAFPRKGNTRDSYPMRVQYDILNALRKVGHKGSYRKIAKLVRGKQELKNYWALLSKSSGRVYAKKSK